MKGLIVGDWKFEIYEKALFDGFQEHGVQAIKFATSEYVSYNHLLRRIMNKLSVGRQIKRVNQELVNLCVIKKPDFIFFQRVNEILPRTIKKIRDILPSVVIINFHNDNPFIQPYRFYTYRNFFRLIKLADINYAYRPSNFADFKKYGAGLVKLLPPYFIKNVDDVQIAEEKKLDVVFVGHYEPDGREEICKHLIDNGVKLYIFGRGWEESLISHYPGVFPDRLKKSEYIRKIKMAKIALVFLSSKNKDSYTRRNFEIPALGTAMITPENDRIKKFFINEDECLMYKDEHDLLEKINYLLNNEQIRKEMRDNARKKCLANYSNVHTTVKIIRDIKNFSK